MRSSQHGCLLNVAGRERTNIKGLSTLANYAFETLDKGAGRAVVLLNVAVPIVLAAGFCGRCRGREASRHIRM
ncbi:hypothetical protein HBH58_177960 [Parastagonospora nodorum]|nr:hypothetical protein HBH58_177960 [Parastagonospora nodorum]